MIPPKVRVASVHTRNISGKTYLNRFDRGELAIEDDYKVRGLATIIIDFFGRNFFKYS